MNPAVSGIHLTTKCRLNCSHCGARPHHRPEADITRPVIDAVKRFGRFHRENIRGEEKTYLRLSGGDVLGWRGEKGEMIGDLAKELKSDVGIERFRVTAVPFNRDEKDRMEAFMSIGEMPGSFIVNFSFNAFARDAKLRPIPMGEMAEKLEFSIKTAGEIGVDYTIIATFVPSTYQITAAFLGAIAERSSLVITTVGGLVSPVGNAIALWANEPKLSLPDGILHELDKCDWDSESLAVLTNGGFVSGCVSVVESRNKPFASIFDDLETIARGINREKALIAELKGGSQNCGICEFHVKASWGESPTSASE
ncbi:MAG: radical SAM protein [Candidatus Micrarchaeota archaeon]|nr:radical SAM protein [Candidatus Micrarchaeota archaeon]